MIFRIFFLLLGILFFVFFGGPFLIGTVNEMMEHKEYCTLDCLTDTLDNFEECIDLGIENIGFLSQEHYYLCDGIKITNTCIEWEKAPDDCKITYKKKGKELK